MHLRASLTSPCCEVRRRLVVSACVVLVVLAVFVFASSMDAPSAAFRPVADATWLPALTPAPVDSSAAGDSGFVRLDDSMGAAAQQIAVAFEDIARRLVG